MRSRTDSALREIWDAYLSQRPLPTLSPARPTNRTYAAPGPNDVATSNTESSSPPKKPTPPSPKRFGKAIQIGERTRKRIGAAVHSFLTWLVWKCRGLKDQVEGWFQRVKHSMSKIKDDDKEEEASTFAESVRANYDFVLDLFGRLFRDYIYKPLRTMCQEALWEPVRDLVLVPFWELFWKVVILVLVGRSCWPVYQNPVMPTVRSLSFSTNAVMLSHAGIQPLPSQEVPNRPVRFTTPQSPDMPAGAQRTVPDYVRARTV